VLWRLCLGWASYRTALFRGQRYVGGSWLPVAYCLWDVSHGWYIQGLVGNVGEVRGTCVRPKRYGYGMALSPTKRQSGIIDFHISTGGERRSTSFASCSKEKEIMKHKTESVRTTVAYRSLSSAAGPSSDLKVRSASYLACFPNSENLRHDH